MQAVLQDPKAKVYKYGDLAIVIYLSTLQCILLEWLKPDGLNIQNISITLVMFFSVFSLFRLIIGSFSAKAFGVAESYLRIVFYGIILYGVILIFRSFSFDKSAFTLFGSPFMSAAWLAPVAFIVGLRNVSIIYLNRISLHLLHLSVFLTPLAFLVDKGLGLSCLHWLSALYFVPLLTWQYQSKKGRYLVIYGVLSFFVLSFLISLRSGYVQLAIHAAMWAILYISRLKRSGKGRVKAFLISLLMVIMAIYMLLNLDLISSNFDESSRMDTRSFLYEEVFADLTLNGQTTFGKGALGRYYSDYFFQVRHTDPNADFYERTVVEVGFLQMLLKGGWTMVCLFLLLVVPVVVKALLLGRSNLCRGLALYCVGFLLIFFILNVPMYSNSYLAFWIILGMCASKSFRSLKDISTSSIK